ncbi:MAG: alpha-rhamnosidase, partial [Deltaproteobacteria bacterium]
GPAWDSAFILIPWYVYLYNGDTAILEKNYEGMKKYVDSMEKWAKNDQHILEYGLGDWCPAKTRTTRTLTSTGYYYADALIISKAAGLLGKTKDQKKYADLAMAIKKAFNKKFYKGDGIYDKGTQTGNSCALYQGLAEEKEIQHLVAKLAADIKSKDDHLDVGILGAKYLFNALTENGQHDLAYRMATQTTYPSYGHWIAKGATTMWEDWKGKSSLNHIMFGDIDAWFYKHLAGINYDPETPGFKHIIVHPRPTGDLTWAKAEHQSPHGLIKTSWNIKNKKFSLNVTIPVNTTATVYIPGKNITEGKSPAAKAKGVSFLRTEKNTSVFKVESGSYRFVSSR